MSAVENFPLLLSEAEEESSAVAPCFSHEGINVCVVVGEWTAYLSACLRVPPASLLSPTCDTKAWLLVALLGIAHVLTTLDFL